MYDVESRKALGENKYLSSLWSDELSFWAKKHVLLKVIWHVWHVIGTFCNVVCTFRLYSIIWNVIGTFCHVVCMFRTKWKYSDTLWHVLARDL